MPSGEKKEMIMGLLSQLIDEMDDYEMEEMKAMGEDGDGEPMAIVKEEKAMPLEEAKEEVMETIDEAAAEGAEEMDMDMTMEEEMEEEDEKMDFPGFVRRG